MDLPQIDGTFYGEAEASCCSNTDKQFALEQAVKFLKGKTSSDKLVLETADEFYEWLND